jgi:DNA polymerase-3 subunit epsilon
MTGGQVNINYGTDGANKNAREGEIIRLPADRAPLTVLMATPDEMNEHESRLDLVESKGGSCLWRQ